MEDEIDAVDPAQFARARHLADAAHALREAVGEVDAEQAAGGAALRNVNGSFYDFTAERFRGTARETLAAPPDEWGGRAVCDWAARLAAGERFDPAAWQLVAVAETLDRLYER